MFARHIAAALEPEASIYKGTHAAGAVFRKALGVAMCSRRLWNLQEGSGDSDRSLVHAARQDQSMSVIGLLAVEHRPGLGSRRQGWTHSPDAARP